MLALWVNYRVRSYGQCLLPPDCLLWSGRHRRCIPTRDFSRNAVLSSGIKILFVVHTFTRRAVRYEKMCLQLSGTDLLQCLLLICPAFSVWTDLPNFTATNNDAKRAFNWTPRGCFIPPPQKKNCVHYGRKRILLAFTTPCMYKNEIYFSFKLLFSVLFICSVKSYCDILKCVTMSCGKRLPTPRSDVLTQSCGCKWALGFHNFFLLYINDCLLDAHEDVTYMSTARGV